KNITDGTSNTLAFGCRYGQTTTSGPTVTPFSLAQAPSLFVRLFPLAQGGGIAIQPLPPVNIGRTTTSTNYWSMYTVTLFYQASAGAALTTSAAQSTGFQINPTVANASTSSLQTFGDGGALVCFFDGSVRSVTPTMSVAVFNAAVTPQGNEVLDPAWNS